MTLHPCRCHGGVCSSYCPETPPIGDAIGAKVDHVRRAGQTRSHGCHWPGCERQVPPAMWGCSKHWYALPAELRGRIWRAYRAGQEEDGRPSREYLAAAHEIQEWIKANRKPPEARLL